MKILNGYNFRNRDFFEDILTGRVLKIVNENEKTVNFQSFILSDPQTNVEFPNFNEPYYTHMEYTLRQAMHSSDECISNVHFVYDDNKDIIEVNVFQRSSNIRNLEEDAQFLNYFIDKYIGENIKLNMFISMPHYFKDRITKI